MAVKIQNPRKQFQFRVIIPGLNPFSVQKIKTPDIEFDSNEHGDTGFFVKTAGIKKIGTITIDKIFDASFPDRAIRDWSRTIRDTNTGGGLNPSEYKRDIVIQQFAPDGISVIEQWEYSGCWPQKINGIDFDLKGSDNTIQSIEFSVDEEN